MTDPAIILFLRRNGLLQEDETLTAAPLTGGVSSDIWLIETPSMQLCIKRALDKLRVAADWHAPLKRNAYEVEWLKRAGAILPGAVPKVLADDPDLGLFAMEFLDPKYHRLWKAELMAERCKPDDAAWVGNRLGILHSAFAKDPTSSAAFPTDDIFSPIRIDPYLVATAQAHPSLSEQILALAARTLTTKRTVVHGDISPKNILIGPSGPIFLDSECAWFGDPSFDLAFCLNHLILKSYHVPNSRPALAGAFDSLINSYFERVDWEPRHELETRVASLLPALLLARIDGKSPVEYLTEERDKQRVRSLAISLLESRTMEFEILRSQWLRMPE